jgi:hypothetical protein
MYYIKDIQLYRKDMDEPREPKKSILPIEEEEKEIYKKNSIKDFPELQPYYDKLFNLSLERRVILDPNTYKKIKKILKGMDLLLI